MLLKLVVVFLVVIHFNQVEAYLEVYIPECAHKIIPQTIRHTLSNFGYIPYGQTYIGQVYVPQNENNNELCTIENEPKTKSPSGSKAFMLVRRGTCKFTQKVLNAQKLGADMVIVYDNEPSQLVHLMMKNDGHGHLVTIPSVFVSGLAGQALLLALKECSKSVLLKQEFDVFETEIASLSLWLNLDNRESYILIRDFQQNDYYNVLEEYVNTSIGFKVYYGCQLLYCEEKDCVGSPQNQYCLPIKRDSTSTQEKGKGDSVQDDDGWRDERVSGSELLKESLRMYVLFEMLPEDKNYIWFSYMDNFDSNLCLEVMDVEECSYQAMRQSGVTQQLIDAIKANISLTFEQINSSTFNEQNIFYHIQKKSDQLNIMFYPEAVINGKNFYGLFKAPQIFEMVCSSLVQRPDECYEMAKNKRRSSTKTIDSSDDLWLTVFLIVLLMTVGFLVALFVYGRLIKREMGQQMSVEVNRMVENYVNMAEQRLESKTKLDKENVSQTGSFQRVQV